MLLLCQKKKIQTIKDKFARKVEMENNEKSLVFKCPKCGSNRLETVFDGIQCVYGGDSNTFDGKQSSIQSTRIKHFSRTAKIQR